MFSTVNGFGCDGGPDVMFGLPIVLLFEDWLNCLLEVFVIAVDNCRDGVDGIDAEGNSLSNILIKNWNINLV